MVVTLVFLIFVLFTLAEDQFIDLPIYSKALEFQTRGFWFQAPVNFRITGLRVPDDSFLEESMNYQSVELVRLDSIPPIYSAVTNDFTSLLRFVEVFSTTPIMLPSSDYVDVYEGDIIGVLGVRGGEYNMYGMGDYDTEICGGSATLQRFGTKNGYIDEGPVKDLFREVGKYISRVEIYYECCVGLCATCVGGTPP